MDLKYLISDCDGVIVDTEYLAAHVMVDCLKEYGVEISVDYYFKNWSGSTFKKVFEFYAKEGNFKLADNYLQDASDRFVAEVDKNLEPIEGVKEAYTNVPLIKSVVSNSYRFHVEHSIRSVGVRALFEDRIFGSDLVENPKPAPDLYLYAMKEIGATPQNAIVIEDSISGATAALAAGLTVIGFTGARHIQEGHDQKLKDLGVQYIIDKMEDLPTLIEKIKSGEAIQA